MPKEIKKFTQVTQTTNEKELECRHFNSVFHALSPASSSLGSEPHPASTRGDQPGESQLHGYKGKSKGMYKVQGYTCPTGIFSLLSNHCLILKSDWP